MRAKHDGKFSDTARKAEEGEEFFCSNRLYARRGGESSKIQKLPANEPAYYGQCHAHAKRVHIYIYSTPRV